MTTPVSNTSNTANTQSPAAQASSAASSASGMETEFLQLLTTQLQNQDPTSPADTNQITQEMAMLGQVEQQTNTNTLLQQLISVMTANQTNNAVSYIGKQVDATSSGTSPAQTELTNSQATMVYNLPAGAANATVTVTNSAGQTLFTGAGTTATGRNQVVWDGSTGTAGVTAPSGTYNFTVTATDSSGKALATTTLTTGTVTAVDSGANGAATLSLGGNLSVPLANVQAVYNPGTDPTS